MSGRIPIAVFSSIPELSAAIRSKLHNIHVENVQVPKPGAMLDEAALTSIQSADILVADPAPLAEHKLTQNLPNLKWFQSTWAGVDSMMRAIDRDQPLPSFHFTRFSGCFGQIIGEYVIGMIISHQRDFTGMYENQKQKKWCVEPFKQYRPLSEMTIGILGMGDIGKDIAKLCKAFGMMVKGLVRRKPNTAVTTCLHVDDYRTVEELPVLLGDCDYICNTLPSTPQTEGLLNADLLKHCVDKKPVLINVGRGDVVDESTLVRALDEGWLGHVILDVYQREPLHADSDLWRHPRVTLTPHVSGVSLPHQVADLFVRNYERYKEDRPLLYPISWHDGY